MSENLKFKILSSIRYFGDALFYPFFSLYLVSVGLVESKIGFILSLTPIVAIIVNPIYSMMCKDINKSKNVLKVITCLEAIIITVIGFSKDFYLISILTVLLAIFGSSHYGLMESLTAVYAASSKNSSYVSIRVYGSIGYILGTSAAGVIIDLFGYNVSFIICSVLFILSGVFYQLIKPIPYTDNEKSLKGSYKEVFKNVKFWLFLIFYILLNSTIYTTDYFLSMYYNSLGVSSKGYGFIYSFYVTFEVIIMLTLNHSKKKFNPDILLLICSVLYTIRMVVFYSTSNVVLTIIFTSIKGIINGILLYILYSYIIDIVGKKNTTIAVLLINLVHTIYVAIGSNLLGNLIENTGYKIIYLIALIIASSTILLGIVRYLLYRKDFSKE